MTPERLSHFKGFVQRLTLTYAPPDSQKRYIRVKYKILKWIEVLQNNVSDVRASTLRPGRIYSVRRRQHQQPALNVSYTTSASVEQQPKRAQVPHLHPHNQECPTNNAGSLPTPYLPKLCTNRAQLPNCICHRLHAPRTLVRRLCGSTPPSQKQGDTIRILDTRKSILYEPSPDVQTFPCQNSGRGR